MADVPQRPFWTVAHECNTPKKVIDALKVEVEGRRVNAIECDISVDPDGNLIVAHDSWPIVEERSDGTLWTQGLLTPSPLWVFGTRIDPYFAAIRSLTADFAAFSLLYLDCKIKTPEQGEALARKVAQYLDATGLAIVYSHGSISGGTGLDPDDEGVLRRLPALLRPNHGIMIDEDPNCRNVVSALRDLGTDRVGYGDGIFTLGAKPGVYRSVVDAVVERTRTGYPRFVNTWTLARSSSIRTFVATGLDAILVNQGTLDELLSIVGEFPELRMAQRSDNPFGPVPPGVIVSFKTDPRTWSGTDAPLRVAVSGTSGVVTHRNVSTMDVNVDGALVGRAEAATTLHVVFQGAAAAVGTPHEVQVTMPRDVGSAPEWRIEHVSVEYGRGQPTLYGHHPDWIVPDTLEQDNPVRIPVGDRVYKFRVDTKDEHGAGTNAGIIFTLDGTNGTLRFIVSGSQTIPATPSSPAKSKDWFEIGRSDEFLITGNDVGHIKRLSVYNDGDGAASAWTLETITVWPPDGSAPSVFVFNEVIDDEQTRARQPVS